MLKMLKKIIEVVALRLLARYQGTRSSRGCTVLALC